MTQTEGVIRYRLEYLPGELPQAMDLSSLRYWFARCRRLGLIGQDPALYDGFAFGNISLRADPGFVISGTQTGGKQNLAAEDLSWVQAVDLGHNRVKATGPSRPSSEAMTHHQVYRALPTAGAVIHAHSAPIWRQAARLGLPLTAPQAAYGTLEMATEVERLLRSAESGYGAFAMGGHQDGIVAYAPDMDSAGELLLELLQRATARS